MSSAENAQYIFHVAEIFLLSRFTQNKIGKATTYFVIEEFIPGRFIQGLA